MKSRLAWKLSAAVVVILAGAIGLSGYINSLICGHCALESARTFLRFNSESNINGIGQLMMNRDIKGVKRLISDISRESKIYGDIRLISHHSGEVVASRFNGDHLVLGVDDRACAICHEKTILDDSDSQIVGEVTRSVNGGRNLSVMAPILNKPSCRSAACHIHADDPPILGFLNSSYSLARVDGMIAKGRVLILFTVIASLLVGIVALRLMFKRLLEKPIGNLIEGTERIATNQLDFRFDQHRDDEIGVLQKSLNTMTARIQAHRDELREAMEYLGGMVENSADIIITVTPDGYIETFNRGAEQVLGYDRIEVIGKQIESLFVDPPERRSISERLKQVGTIRNYEARLLAKNGQVCHVLLTLSYLRDREGNPSGTIGISKDITKEKQLQRELVQSQKLAAIGQAVTGIQHAIKNMLNALTGGTYIIRSGISKDNKQSVTEGCSMVEEGVGHIRDLSNNMLKYVREWKVEPQRVNLNELITKIIELNRQAATDRGVAIGSELSRGLPEVLCDPELLHMAITDILVNAVDACVWKDYGRDESPEVALKTSLDQDTNFYVIGITDNGCGMDEGIRINIFTPFFSTKKVRGTGLGLALTAKIINVHDGEIVVDSEPGHGTAFRICLPVDGPRSNREFNND